MITGIDGDVVSDFFPPGAEIWSKASAMFVIPTPGNPLIFPGTP